MFPTTCVLVTLPPGIVAKGFELSRGFQPKGFLKGTEVVTLMGGATMGPNVVTVGVYPEGFGEPLTVVMTVTLELGICLLLGLASDGIELTTSGDDGGEPGRVSIGIDPVDASGEMDVCAVK